MSDLEKQTWTPGPEFTEHELARLRARDDKLSAIEELAAAPLVHENHMLRLMSIRHELGVRENDPRIKERSSSPDMAEALRSLIADVEQHHADNHRKPIEVVFPHIAIARAVLERVARAKAQVTPEQK